MDTDSESDDSINELYAELKNNAENDPNDLIEKIYENYKESKRNLALKKRYFRKYYQTQKELKLLGDACSLVNSAYVSETDKNKKKLNKVPVDPVDDNFSRISYKSKNPLKPAPNPLSRPASVFSQSNHSMASSRFKLPQIPGKVINPNRQHFSVNNNQLRNHNETRVTLFPSKAKSTIAHNINKPSSVSEVPHLTTSAKSLWSLPRINQSSAKPSNPFHDFWNPKNTINSELEDKDDQSEPRKVPDFDNAISSSDSDENVTVHTLSPVISKKRKRPSGNLNNNKTILSKPPKKDSEFNIDKMISDVKNPIKYNPPTKLNIDKNIDKKELNNHKNLPTVNLRVIQRPVYEQFRPIENPQNESTNNNTLENNSKMEDVSRNSSSYNLRTRSSNKSVSALLSLTKKKRSKSNCALNESTPIQQSCKRRRTTPKNIQYQSFMPDETAKRKRKLFQQPKELPE